MFEDVFEPWIHGFLRIVEDKGGFDREVQTLKKRMVRLKRLLEKSEDELLWNGKRVLEYLDGIVCAVLLMGDACADGDEIAGAVARRWVVGMKLEEDDKADEEVDWNKEATMDRRIFLGDRDVGFVPEMKSQAKL